MSTAVRFSARSIEDLGEIFDYLLPRAGEKAARNHCLCIPGWQRDDFAGFFGRGRDVETILGVVGT